MHIQGRKLKNGKEPQKGVLNEFTGSRTVTFKEQETKDVVDVTYQMEENEKGYFAECTIFRQDRRYYRRKC